MNVGAKYQLKLTMVERSLQIRQLSKKYDYLFFEGNFYLTYPGAH